MRIRGQLCLVLALAACGDTSTEDRAARARFLREHLIAANQYVSDPAIRREKYDLMSRSAYAFLRGSAPLYYADIAAGRVAVPPSWAGTPEIDTWILGDFHTQNVGAFDNDAGAVTFDLNDFDESYVAPFYWDTLRGATAVFLLQGEIAEAGEWKLGAGEAQDLALALLESYQGTLERCENSDIEKTAVIDRDAATGFVRDHLDKITGTLGVKAQLAAWTVVGGDGERRFDLTNVDIGAAPGDLRSRFASAWPEYTAGIDIGSFPSGYFTIKDVALRLHAGIGSLGVRRYYVLVEGPGGADDDDVILDVKEQLRPALLASALADKAHQYETTFPDHAARAAVAQRAMLSFPDRHLGALTISDRPYLVRRLSPYRHRFDTPAFHSKSDLADFLQASGAALAYAHARADRDFDAKHVPHDFERGALAAIAAWQKAKTTMRDIAEAYADKVRFDHSIFLDLLASGELP